MILHLLADTNLFFECRPLGDLPWSELGADTVVVVLTKPINDEIDAHKKATGRTRERALAISGRLRAMLRDGRGEDVIREAAPRVTLRFAPNLVPAPDLRDQLGGYARADDKLVGLLATLTRGGGIQEFALFTHDTGPAASAAGLGLSVRLIEDHWLRPPAESQEAKQARELRAQLAAYQAQEPSVAVTPLDDPVVEAVRRVALPLGEAEVEAMLAALREGHPMETDFTPPADPIEPGAPEPETMLAPPEEAEVRRYQDEAYPRWLDRCRTVLRGLHEGRDQPEGTLRVGWRLTNEGSRPATQVRVVVEVLHGPLALLRPRRDKGEDGDAGEARSSRPAPRLPPPPPPPAFCRLPRPKPPPPPVVTPPPSASTVASPARAGVSLDLATLRAALPSTAVVDQLGSARSTLDEAMTRAGLGVGGALERAMLAAGGIEDLSEAARAAAMGSSMVDALKASDLLGHAGVLGAASRLFEEDQRMRDLLDMHRNLGIGRMASADLMPSPSLMEPLRLDLPKPYVPPRHEPEAFYFDDWPFDRLVRQGALTCDLWRHRSEPVEFEWEVVVEANGSTGGRVRCSVHADNLTEPARCEVSVLRRIEEVSMAAEGWGLVEACG